MTIFNYKNYNLLLKEHLALATGFAITTLAPWGIEWWEALISRTFRHGDSDSLKQLGEHLASRACYADSADTAEVFQKFLERIAGYVVANNSLTTSEKIKIFDAMAKSYMDDVYSKDFEPGPSAKDVYQALVRFQSALAKAGIDMQPNPHFRAPHEDECADAFIPVEIGSYALDDFFSNEILQFIEVYLDKAGEPWAQDALRDLIELASRTADEDTFSYLASEMISYAMSEKYANASELAHENLHKLLASMFERVDLNFENRSSVIEHLLTSYDCYEPEVRDKFAGGRKKIMNEIKLCEEKLFKEFYAEPVGAEVQRLVLRARGAEPPL